MTDLLSRVLSQDTAVTALRRALAGNSVHHAYLFEGPPGVGKELVALGLAQALVCERRAEGAGVACGDCSACKRAELGEEGTTRHPDIVFIERGLYEPQRIGRRTAETQDISIDQIRTLVLARAAFGPHEGKAKVFIVRRAEELSASAANALLKTLEEPGARTHFILLSARPNELLPTVRSRAMRVRFGFLPDKTVARLLEAEGVAADDAQKAAFAAAGSMQEARIAADPEQRVARDTWVEKVLNALARKDRGAGYLIAEDGKKDKGKLAEDLLSLASALRTLTRQRVEAGDPKGAAMAEAYTLVMQARDDLDANNAPQLVVESLYFALADMGISAGTASAPTVP